MTIDLKDIHPADYVIPGSFDREPEGLYALGIARSLERCGVETEEWVSSIEELARRLAPHYDDALVSDDVRKIPRELAGRWAGRCEPAAVLLDRASDAVRTGKNLAFLVVHLYRIADQLSLLRLPEQGT